MPSPNSPRSTPRSRSLSGEILSTRAPRRPPPPPSRLDWQRIGAALSAATGLLGLAISAALTVLKFRSDCRCAGTLINTCSDLISRISPRLEQLFDCGAAFSSAYSQLLGLPLTVHAAALYAIALGLSLGVWRGGPAAPRRAAWLFVVAVLDVLASCVMFLISHAVLGAWCLFCFALYFLSASLLTSAALALHGAGAAGGGAPLRDSLRPRHGVRLALLGLLLVALQAAPYWSRCDLPTGCVRAVPPPPPTRLVFGAEHPEVVVAVIFDPSCTACKAELAWLQDFVRASELPVAVHLHHFPREQSGCGLPGVRVPAHSLEAANSAACDLCFAVECIADRPGAGPDDGLRALDTSFRTMGTLVPSAHLRTITAAYAADASAQQALAQCVRGRQGPIADRIAAHMRYAVDLDVRVTPTVLVAPTVAGAARWDLAQVFAGRSESRLRAAIARAQKWAARP